MRYLLAAVVLLGLVSTVQAGSMTGCVEAIIVSQRFGSIEGPEYVPPQVKVAFKLIDSKGEHQFFTFMQLGLMAHGMESFVPADRFALAVEPQLAELRAAAAGRHQVSVIWDDQTKIVSMFTVRYEESCVIESVIKTPLKKRDIKQLK